MQFLYPPQWLPGSHTALVRPVGAAQTLQPGRHLPISSSSNTFILFWIRRQSHLSGRCCLLVQFVQCYTKQCKQPPLHFPPATCVFSPHWQGIGAFGAHGDPEVRQCGEPLNLWPDPSAGGLAAHRLHGNQSLTEKDTAATERPSRLTFLTPLRPLPARHLGAEATGWRHSRA